MAGGLLGDAPRAGMRHFVRFADHERIERETRIQRRRDIVARIRLFLGVRARFRDFDGLFRRHLDHRTRGSLTMKSTRRTAGHSACHNAFTRAP